MAATTARGAASLLGEQVTLTVRYQVSPQGGAPIDQVLYTSSFTVGAGVEVSSQPVSFTYLSGGFNQTISGNVSADVGASSMSVTFSGTQQPGGLLFVLSSVTDQSAAGISSATLNSSSGFTSGVNLAQSPSFSNTGDGSVTANMFLLGFQPGVTLTENISFALVTSPTVTTTAATGVTASGATLNGTVNANGVSTTATFQYGLTTSYGNSVAATPGTVTGSTVSNITATLSGLIPGATYHYRAVGTVPGGVARGADQTFTIAANSTVSVLGTPAWTNSGATYANFTVPAGNNRLLVVAASGENYNGTNTIDLTGVTFNGSAMTQGIKRTDTNYLVDGLYYVALGTSASPTTANIVVTAPAVTTITSIGAVVFQNANQATPLSGFQSAIAVNTTPSINSSTVTVASTSGDMVIDLLDMYDPNSVFVRTPTAGQSFAFTGGDPVSFSGTEFYSGTLKLGAASVPMTWALSNAEETIQIAANIKQSAAANVAPTITTQPTNLTVNSGSTATFNAAASGTPTPTAQWQVSTNGGTSFANVPGATNTTLSFTAATTDNGSQYRAIFTNVAGSATNTAATLTVIGPATKLVFAQQPTSATAGSSITPAITVQIQDAAGHLTASTASVTIGIGTNPGGGTLSGTTNVNAVGGVATFSGLSIDKAGSGYTLSAASAGLTGTNSSSFNITAGAATHFSVSAPANATAGTAFNFTVTALDAFNNTATGYSGSAHFTSTDGAATLPANSTLTSGAGTFSATLKTAGARTITATDTVTGSITGTSGNISVAPTVATHFAVSAPANATAGTAFNFTVTALDQFNNTATGYSGTAHFTSSDGAATMPANATLTSGVGTFSATLKTSGSQTVTAADTVTGSINGTSGNIAVAAAAATHFTVSAPANATAGTAFNFTVTALDQFNNTATGYSGTAHFTSSDSAAVLPGNSTLTSGAGTFSATLKTAGTQALTATDTVTGSINGTSGNVAVAAASATHFTISAPGSATAGTAFNFTVTALDAFNNTVTGYSGTAHFTSTDGAATLPANATLTSGVGTFSATLKTSGTQTITATDTVTGSINGTSGNVTVAATAATHFAVSAPANATAGTAFSFTVTARDQFNNTVTGYSGIAHFTSTDGSAVLPADATLTSGVGTFSATLATSGTRTITATDTVSSSITGTSGNILVAAAAATHFTVSAPASATAGVAFNFTVTALDQFNNTATGYSGVAHFTSTDGAATLPANATLTSGAGTFSATLKTAGNQTVSATDTVTGSITGTSGTVSVSPASASHFAVSAPANATAGTAFNFTVTAQDAFNNAVTSYSGTAHFTSTDGSATLPADAALTSGVGTFSATLITAGTRTISATDTVTSSITGTSGNILVGGAAATHFTVSAPANATAGTAFNFTVTARDQFNNTATGYTGTAHFTSTDGSAVLPADSTLTSGLGTFSATLKTAGTQTLTATDTATGSINGTSGNVTVSPAAATHFTVSAPANATAGTAFNFTVTAFDPFNNIVTGYGGTVHFTSSDAAAVLPANATLTSGTGNFSATLKTSGTQTITATDTVQGSISGTSGNVIVGSALATHFTVTALPNTTAGNPFTFTVTALDQFNNIVTTYGGVAHFTSSDSAAVLQADTVLFSGIGIFTATLKTAGAQTIIATDTTTPSINGSSGTILVGPAAATHFTVSAPANATAGTAFNFTVTALDQFNNTATTYTGLAHFTASDNAAVLPADAALTAGVGTFSATLKTAGTQTIAATDTVTGSITGISGSIAVSPAAATHFTVGAPANATAGTAFNITVTALDQFNNTATGYSGTAHFTSSDGAAVLPANATLTSAVGIFSATLKTAGTQTIAATDTVSGSINGTSGNVVVSAAAATHFTFSVPAVAKARIATNFTATALDAFGNTATAYVGTVHFTSTDALATLPADSALVSGVQTFSLTMGTAGIQTVTATDTINSAVTGTSAGIDVLDLQIVVPPVNQFALPGSNATFNVAVSGTAPFAYQWLSNSVTVPGATNSSLTISNVTAQTGTNYQVVITNAWGSLTSSVVTLTLSGVLSYTNTLQSGSANLNPITGLYEEKLNVTNIGGTVSGLRLLVSNLPPQVTLYHATGTNNGLPYNDFAVTMTNGQVSTFLLQFFNPFRTNFTNSVYVVALNAGSGTLTTTNTVAGIPISTVLIDNSIPGSPRFTLAFTSVVGRNYQVLYSDDGMQTWALADTLTANSTWTIWTELLPPASGNRFFKVIVLP